MNEDNTYTAADSGDDGVPAGTPADTASFPWPPAGHESLINALGRTWQGASLKPSSFFARMPEHGSLGAFILYYLAIGIAVSGAQLFWSSLRGATSQEREIVAGTVDSAFAMSPLVNFLMSPLFLLVSLFLTAAVVHALLKLMGGASRDYMFTVRLLALAYSPQLIGVLPGFANVLGFMWMVVVAIIALRVGHRTTGLRAAAAVLLPLFIAVTFIAVAVLMLRASGMLDLPTV